LTSIVWVISGLIVLIGIFLLLWFLPKWQIKKTGIVRVEDQFSAENEARKTLAQIFGGAAIIIGLIFSWQTIESQRKTLELQRDDLNIAKEQQITERFTRAIEQLGSEKLEVRLGGIYSLERIAKDSPNDHWTIVEILTTYAKDKSNGESKETVKSTTNGNDAESPSVKTDIQAIMTVLGRRNRENDKKDAVLNLQGVNLKGAQLSEYDFAGANFQNANLTEANLANTNFAKAQLQGSKLKEAYLVDADLESAQLTSANLEGAYLQKANLKSANLENANFKGAKLDEAILDETLILNANFESASLAGASIINVKLWDPSSHEINHLRDYLERRIIKNSERWDVNFSDANLGNANMESSVYWRANMSNANLSNANLHKIQLHECNLEKADLTDAVLTQSIIRYGNFGRVKFNSSNFEGSTIELSSIGSNDLIGINIGNAFLDAPHFHGVTLQNVSFENSTLRMAKFEDVVLKEVNFKGAELKYTNFTNATIENANFMFANFEDVNIVNSVISGLTGLAIEQLCKVKSLRGSLIDSTCYINGSYFNYDNQRSSNDWDAWDNGDEIDCMKGIVATCPELLTTSE